MKLYPPIIEGTIPAFYGTEIKVPYEMNKAVNRNIEVKGFSLKIKTVQSNRYLGDISKDSDGNWLWREDKSGELIFTIPQNIYQLMNVGEFYKVQLAYINNANEVGYYSTVGVVKCTSEPDVTISTSTDGISFTGLYSQKNKDITEKVYSYRFDLTDSSGNIYETSGEQLHNNSLDTEIFESNDQFIITKELYKNKVYYLTYTITTVNGLIKSSEPKRLTKTDSIDSKLRTKLTVKLDYENGYVDLSLTKPKEDLVEESAVGSFMLLRASDEDNYSSWNEVLKFVLYGQLPSRHLWKDMTVKQGVNYKYAIQQYNEHGLRTNKIESDIIHVDFEHAFLFDGKRQLKIKYNPKVSSFKNTLLESKVDTIGSKHPFIFRNGNVKYKEFPISGMISYLSDENNLFYDGLQIEEMTEEHRYDNEHNKITIVSLGPITESHYLNNYSTYYIHKIIKNPVTKEIIDDYFLSWKEYLNIYHPEVDILHWPDVQLIINDAFRDEILYENFRQQQYLKLSDSKIKTTNLTSHNIHMERNFKLEALEWLTDGNPKLFRSPGEGNYLVRLLNVSMTPQDSLGRMLHTFNCTAYEIADYTYKNLADFNIITTENPTVKQLRWQTVEFPKNGFADGENVLKYPASSIYLEGMVPGDKIYIDDGIVRNGEQGYNIVIGSTGSYIINLKNDVLINKISFEGSPDNIKDEDGTVRHQGSLTYSYYTTDFKDSFDTVHSIDVKQIPTQQFIGEQKNIVKSINNIKQRLSSIGYIRFYLRNSDEELYRHGNDLNTCYYTTDKEGGNRFDPRSTTNLYLVHLASGGTVYYDGYNNKDLPSNLDPHEATSIIFNENEDWKIDLWDTYSYEIKTPENITSIAIGDGVICEITYQIKEIGYDIEKGLQEDKNGSYKKYETALKNYLNLVKSPDANASDLVTKLNTCKDCYKTYLIDLEQAIANAERR